MPKANVIARRHTLRSAVIDERIKAGLYQPPDASERVERLVKKKSDLGKRQAEIKAELDVINNKLLRAVKAEGEQDPEGKVRLQAEHHNLLVVSTSNKTIDAKMLRALGVKQSIIDQATKETPYEYVYVGARAEEKGK